MGIVFVDPATEDIYENMRAQAPERWDTFIEEVNPSSPGWGPSVAPQPCQREEGFTVPRRTVCGEAVERSAGRSGTVDPSSTLSSRREGAWTANPGCVLLWSESTSNFVRSSLI